MKHIMTLTLLILNLNFLIAQTHGNGKITTTTKSMVGLKTIDIQFNANIVLDYAAAETMTMTIDDNLVDLVGVDFTNGKLSLDQIKWIDPSKLPTIIIGTPKLGRVYQGTHSTTSIVNAKSSQLSLEGNVGKIIASGTVDNLRITVSGTDLDLEDLEVETAVVDLIEGSKITFGKVKRLESEYKNDRRIKLLEAPDEHINRQGEKASQKMYTPNAKLEFIAFDIKNNSWGRNHFTVLGPKRDGSTFSYGFAMLPQTKKSEKWSVGTKIYKEGRNGKKTLLVTIEESDAGEIVNLFP